MRAGLAWADTELLDVVQAGQILQVASGKTGNTSAQRVVSLRKNKTAAKAKRSYSKP